MEFSLSYKTLNLLDTRAQFEAANKLFLSCNMVCLVISFAFHFHFFLIVVNIKKKTLQRHEEGDKVFKSKRLGGSGFYPSNLYLKAFAKSQH